LKDQNAFKSPSRGGVGIEGAAVDTQQYFKSNALSKSSNEGKSLRRLSHSPVSVNTTYELGFRNTEKLWREFNNNLRRSASGS